MENKVEKMFLHPNLSDVVLFKQYIEANGTTSNVEICIYNGHSNYKRTFDLQTKTGMADLKEYTRNMTDMLAALDTVIIKSEYALWKAKHGYE